MKKRLALPLVALALFGVMAAFASAAQAHPSYPTQCSSCHSGTNVPVTATLATTVGTTATYNVSAPTATAMAVFDGATKVGTEIIGTSGSVALPVGKTYTVFAVKGPSTNTGIGSKSVSPAALPPADTTAPKTTSDAGPSYTNAATIHLTAVDNAGGSGVAHTYYILDSTPQAEGTTVNTALGSHTLQFWSVDVAGNIETPRNSATFTVSAPVPDVTAPTTVSDAVANYNGSATIHLTPSDNAGGSGVAHTYYILDSTPQAEGKTVNTTGLGSHTLQFWSVDVAGNIETPANTAAFEVTAALTPPVEVHRFYNRQRHSHFYTASESEKEYVVEHLSATYTYEGVAYTINPLNPDNQAPLYRFYDKVNGSHFYTADAAEKNDLVATMSDTYSYEGVAYTVSTTPTPDATTVYRFYNKRNGSHFYTANAAEKNRVLTTLSRTYTLDGPAFYLAP